MAGTDQVVGVTNQQSTTTIAQVDTSQITTASDVVVVRQRIAIGDPTMPNAFLDIDPMVRARRQLDEFIALAQCEHSLNLQGRARHSDRTYFVDRRGAIGRGITR
jgi:c-di-GMP-binding flagellar brake protein YcgR